MTARPRYHLPPTLVVPRIPSFLLAQRRSFAHDSTLAFAAVHATPHVIGAEHIPAREPFLLVMNHYHRHDIPAWWLAMATFKAVAARRGNAREMRLLIASQWTYNSRAEKMLVEPLTRFMIDRIARAYDFLTIEPTALGGGHTQQRAQSMRRIVEAAKRAVREQQPLAMAPEGGDSPDGSLVRPPAGAGRFMLLLASTGLPLLPVGNYVADEVVVSHFGEVFLLQAPAALKRAALDEWAANEVMTHIAHLLPPELHGAYRGSA